MSTPSVRIGEADARGPEHARSVERDRLRPRAAGTIPGCPAAPPGARRAAPCRSAAGFPAGAAGRAPSGGAGTARRRQRLDLVARERPPQVRQRPSRFEHRRLRVVHVVHQEHALLQAESRRSTSARSTPAAGPFQPVEHPRLVPFGLQPAEEPGAGVAEALVVEVDRVLRGQDDAQAERPALLEQRQQRRLRRRVRHRRKVAEDFVHVEERAQAGRAGLPAHPATIWFISSDTKNMRSASPRWAIENTRHARPAVRCVEQRLRDRAARPRARARSPARPARRSASSPARTAPSPGRTTRDRRRRPCRTAGTGPAGSAPPGRGRRRPARRG